MLFSAFRKRRGLGLLAQDVDAPQSPNKRDWGFDLLGLSEADQIEAVSLERYVRILNQGDSETCVAQAWELALQISRTVAGIPDPGLGSRLFGYSNSRALHNAERVDRGTFLRSYANALKKGGNCPEAIWPFNLSNVNKLPPARAFRAAWGHRGIKGYYKIFEQGDQRTAAIRAALVNSMPVVFGTLVDKAFTEDNGSQLISIPSGNLIGGHAMCCIGFKRVGTEYVYQIANSWGPFWRSYGFAWFTEEFMQWYMTQDLWVVSLV